MLANLEALHALADHETMGKAATRLRVTQSAISKRVASLETALGAPLIERSGRRVILTVAGVALVDRTRSPLAEIRAAFEAGPVADSSRRLVIGVSESILASWGPRLLDRVTRQISGLDLALHTHRSPVAIDGVRSGAYALAIVAGLNERIPDLSEHQLVEEQMVLLSGRGRSPVKRWAGDIPVLTIEPASATWPVVRRRLRRLEREHDFRIEVTTTVQSFAAVVQMARSGFGHGLVPEGLARAMGVPQSALKPFPGTGLWRPISLVARPRTLASDIVREFSSRIVQAAASVRSLRVSSATLVSPSKWNSP